MADWISWSAYYSIGVHSIDGQHRELFRRFNQVCDAVWDGKGRDHVKDFLSFLAQYVQEHFGNEESQMQKHGFPGYEDHKKVHDALVADVSAFLHKYETEDVASYAVVKVITDLGDWTRDHIRSLDQDLGTFLLKQEGSTEGTS
jgi:hemerythrin